MLQLDLISFKCEAPKCKKTFYAEGNAPAKDTCCTHCGSKKFDYLHDAPARNKIVC